MPEEDRYDGYLQLENGVGMLRLLEKEFHDALENAKGDEIPRKVSIATGKLAAPVICKFMKELKAKYPKTEVSVRSVEDTYENHDKTKGKLKDHEKWARRKECLSKITDKMDLKDFADWLDSDNFKEWITTNEHSPFVNLKLTQDEISDLSDFVYGISMAVITKEHNDNVQNYLRKIADRFKDNKDNLYEILNKIIDYVVGDVPFYNYIVSGKTIYCEINKNEGGSILNIILPIAISKDELENGKYDDIDESKFLFIGKVEWVKII